VFGQKAVRVLSFVVEQGTNGTSGTRKKGEDVVLRGLV